MNNQPKWKCIAQLGDANPIDHGGAWVLVDKTGKHDPMLEILEVHDLDNEVLRNSATVLIDRCTFIDGVLSDNEFHPSNPAWFAKDIDGVASCIGMDRQELIDRLCSADPIQCAMGYLDLIAYYGQENFGGYDFEQMTRSEAKKRYSRATYKIK